MRGFSAASKPYCSMTCSLSERNRRKIDGFGPEPIDCQKMTETENPENPETPEMPENPVSNPEIHEASNRFSPAQESVKMRNRRAPKPKLVEDSSMFSVISSHSRVGMKLPLASMFWVSQIRVDQCDVPNLATVPN